ncbi:uncharacterized protein LOC126740241 [Anthonomus grandis grandis]|uniref:uncharacterized protein LOC126740241 n=1 Tax=Anthonomus grandis grandis TaxID=2921223 RepID=UPI002166A720|nr:uncharacterized protein LOC126740241 [Anthonomus grandis grandis]
MFLTRPAVIFSLLTSYLACGKIYQRCELARELRNFDVPENEISTWVCIAKYESLFDTAAMNHGSGDHGLFQISELYWCSPPGQGYGCNSPCSKFRDDDISDDLQCIRRIYNEHKRISGDGFNAWVVYPLYCKGDTSTYISDCFDDNTESLENESLPSNNVTENEISTSEESGEYGDGYQFPSLPDFSNKYDKTNDDGSEIPGLPKIEMNPAKSVGRMLPFDKVSIHNFVSVNKPLPYSKVSISYFIPAKSVNNNKISLEKFPFSKKSIHHFESVLELPTTTKEELLKTTNTFTKSINNLRTISSTSAPSTMKSLATFNRLEYLTVEKTNTEPCLNLKNKSATVASYQAQEKIILKKIVPKDLELELSSSTLAPSTFKSLPTIKHFQPFKLEKATTETPLNHKKNTEIMAILPTYENQKKISSSTLKSLPIFNPLKFVDSDVTTKNYKTTLASTVKLLPTFRPLQFLNSNTKTRNFETTFVTTIKPLPTFKSLPTFKTLNFPVSNTTTRTYEATSLPTVKPLPTFKSLPTFKTLKFPASNTTTRNYTATFATTVKPLPTFKPFTFESIPKKSPFIFQRSGFANLTTTQSSQANDNKTLTHLFGHSALNAETAVTPKPAINQFTTLKPSARQVTFAPDSWFSWIFSSQTLPPILPPPPRPPAGNPDRPRPGGLRPPGSTPLERPPGPPRPMRPSDQVSVQRPLGPNRRPELGGFGNQPSRIQPGLQQVTVRPFGVHRPVRPFANRAKNVDSLTEIHSDESVDIKKSKNLEGAEIMLDNHSVFVRTSYGFRLFHTK